MAINCIITDDEPIARSILKNYIDKIPDFNLVGECNNALETMSKLKEQQVDLLFLDIQMPEISGLEFLKSLSNPPLVIFTTAYQEYALEGYELNVCDYLLKPISFDRFLKAANKAMDRLKLSTPQPNAVLSNAETSKEYTFIKDSDELIKVWYKEILYIEGLKDYVKVICEDRRIVTLSTMKNMEQMLPSNFKRIHRSYIINTDQILSITGNSVRIGKELISYGKSYKENFDALKKQ